MPGLRVLAARLSRRLLGAESALGHLRHRVGT